MGLSGGITYAWHRSTTISIPETVHGHRTDGMRAQIETRVDDQDAICINGKCNHDSNTVPEFNVAKQI